MGRLATKTHKHRPTKCGKNVHHDDALLMKIQKLCLCKKRKMWKKHTSRWCIINEDSKALFV